MKNTNSALLYKVVFQQPDQRVSSYFKMTNKDWYIQNANYCIKLCMGQDDKVMTRKFLNAANGLIDKETYDYVLKNYTSELADKGKLYGEIRDVDFLTPIKERYMGEFINMFSNYQIFNNDPDIVLIRNKYLADKVMGWINQGIINKLNEAGVKTNQESQEQLDINQFVEEELEKWRDDVVITSQKRLELINALIDAKDKYQQLYFYWWACEECYTYREIYKNDIYFNVVHPMEYYRVDSGSRYIEDDDFGCRRFKLKLSELTTRFRDYLSDKEIDYLEKLYSSRSVLTYDMFIQFIKSLDDFAERKAVLDKHREAYKDITLNNDEIEVFHYVWKTKTPYGVLVYKNALGELKETIVDEYYELDKDNGDVEIRWEWKEEVWGGYRFGGEVWGIYLPPEPIPCQREKFNNISDCKLPYNGIVGLVRGNLRNPIPFRVAPYLALYRIYTLQEERAIAKFKSWLLFPETILGDTNKMTTEQRLAIANKDSFLPFDDADLNANALQSIREVANTTVINYINVLRDLKDALKRDAYEVANMNSARIGDTKDYAGKGVTEMNYQNAVMGSVWSLEVFNLFREKDYLANLDYSKYAWIDGKKGSYIDPNTGELIIVDLDGSSDFSSNIGVYIKNNNDVTNMLNQMKEFAFNVGQNGMPDVALEAITNRNTMAIKRNIKKAIEAQREYEMQMQQLQEQARAETEKIISEREAMRIENENQQKALDREKDIMIEQMKIESEERIVEAKLKIDVNGNGYIDKEEAMMAQNGYTQNDINRLKLQKELNRKI